MAKVSFTAGRISDFRCPSGKDQDFLWDADQHGLGLRVTAGGKSTYVFQSLYQRTTVRISIGSPSAWGIKEARAKARELQREIDEGRDPRELKRNALAQAAARKAAAAAKAVTVGEAWAVYVVEGRPKRKDAWKPRYLADLNAMAAPGGLAKKRGKGLTRPGPLYPLMVLTLDEVTEEDNLKVWYDREAMVSAPQAARAWMMFRGFLRWCATRPAYRRPGMREAAQAPAIIESLPATKRRTDALEAAQVRPWWDAVEQMGNPVASAYLRALLLSGARREEMAALEWEHIDFRWKKLTLADKVDATRTIPLSPYMEVLLTGLPRRSRFVFASASKSGRISDARSSHQRALATAGIQGLTIHGLRRSFSLLAEAAGAPAGAIAQIMGHKPSATAEGYRPRSVDALRPFSLLIERHLLALAQVKFESSVDASRLHAVA
jgi:integrase